ncbi:NADH oxidase [Xylariales sp. PMI_506]|nr:NADH oxidase [Xylariales sp. PMI_506]
MAVGTDFPRFESGPGDVARLGEPIEFYFSKRVAKNRFLKAAMSETLATYHDTDLAARGIPGPELINLYRRWGEGGWGQIQTGNVMIDPGHLEAPANMIVSSQEPFEGERFEAFKAIAEAAKAHGSLIVAQVSHSGRQVSDDVQKHPISASAVPLVTKATGKTYAVPRAATKEDIAGVIEGFAHAAEYLEKAGFDGIELHGAHGYLLAQFLSPTTNQRTDEYGGSLENRARLILEVAAAVKARVSPSFVLGIKINSVEFQDGGFTGDDAAALCQALEDAEFDYVETSGGTYETMAFVHAKESTRRRENYFVEFTERVHSLLKGRTRVYTTGGFRTVGGMVEILSSVDGVGIGRAATQEPDLPLKLLSGAARGVAVHSVGDDDIRARLLASKIQIMQMGRDQELLDFTAPESVDKVYAFMAARDAAAKEAAAKM